ncbi:Stage V sporulation protein K [Gimesia alba]|uniref:Stage V sporulation protein K n=1 Tax=Gimesia alba TaxID=2527973 RepID=A0A517RLL8_9PLAN|nr:AAA family ATPase [Gimesia alba]QDT44777.1 Stage V sporulation protein K [Gimesia alba]
MSNAEKLESMLEFLCNDVYEVISANLEKAREYTEPDRMAKSISGLFEFACLDEGLLLKQVINASAFNEILHILRDSILTDYAIDEVELVVSTALVKHSLHRFCWQEDYQQYQNGCDAAGFQRLLVQWESDPAWLGGGILDGAIVNPFEKFILIACFLNASDDLFQTYKKVLLQTAKIILNANGIQSADQVYFSELNEYLSTVEQSFCFELLPKAQVNQNSDTACESTSAEQISQIEPEEALEQGLKELNSLIGLYPVKREVTRLTNFLKIRQQRLDQGLPVASQTLHFVFTGNPGTGKTTVARIIAKILYGFQILKTANFIEADRATMVGGYVGQTAIKSNEVISQATDGVLFIDEAYSLAKSGGQDYGQEAIETLLKKMEDLRDRLVVIVAGYPNEMAEFISSNPGLESRFSRYIVFDDYHVSDLCQIFEMMCRSNSYQLTPEARGNLAILLNRIFRDRDQNFGNARLVRNAYERTLGNHADRLATSEGKITREALSTIEAVDLPFKMADGISQPFDLTKSIWHVNCPQCENSTSASLPFLGQIVKCNNCGTRFRCPWWNLDRNTVRGLEGFEIYERAADLDGYDMQPEKAEA